jgi:hypothetical protein
MNELQLSTYRDLFGLGVFALRDWRSGISRRLDRFFPEAAPARRSRG